MSIEAIDLPMAKKTEAPALSYRSKVGLTRLALVLVVFGFWEFASGSLFSTFWISKPSLIAAYIFKWIFYGDFFYQLSFTFGSMIAGFTLGTVLGLLAGVVLSRSQFASDVLDPFLVAINGIPRVALAPLFVVWFGIDMLPKIILVFTLVFFVIFYNTYAGIKSVDRRFTDLAFVMGANANELFRKVILPASLPHIFLGIKLSIPYALIGAIIGEFVASSAGLGWKIQMETSLYNTTGTMAGLIVMMFIVVAMNSMLAVMERQLLRWQPTSRFATAQSQ
ncbi:MAG: ABC transporter permease [Actinobacteria bacterium]|nr:ABC transporter permease [Actinomycetota bacterium]